MEGKATAIAHPIQGIVKYHGMRDHDLRLPYHDSISVCTAPSRTKTTVEFDTSLDEDEYRVDDAEVHGSAAERIQTVVDAVRDRAETQVRIRLHSESNFPTNVGLGSSSSGFAAAAIATVHAAGLDLSRPTISTIARRGSASAARSVTGGISILEAGLNDAHCRSHRIETDLEDQLQIVVGLVPAYKETARAHEEAEDSHMFSCRLAHVHEQLARCRDALQTGDFDTVFDLAERDSLSLAATTMTGPEAWIYWRPETLEIFQRIRNLRHDEAIPAYVSTDTGATVYVNTTENHVDEVRTAVGDCGVETRSWTVGGPARVVGSDEALF